MLVDTRSRASVRTLLVRLTAHAIDRARAGTTG